MDVLNISDFTDASADSNSMGIVSLDEISLLDGELLFVDNRSSDTNNAESEELDEDGFVVDDRTSFTFMDENEEEEEEHHNQIAFAFDDSSIMEESTILELASSFPDNLCQSLDNLSESLESASCTESFMSGSYGGLPEIIGSTAPPFRLPFSRRLHNHTKLSTFSTTTQQSKRSLPHGEEQEQSAPYAQLCFDRKRKSLVSMLEVDIVSGRRRHHSRLPMDAPDTDDFPWLHQDTTNKVLTGDELLTEDKSETTGSTISQKMSFSSSSSDGSSRDENDTENDSEPIILSGWMIHVEEMSEEEADIYWLLNDGNDVWVKVDDGCAKALQKMWTSCSRWKIKRSKLFHQPSMNDDEEDRHNKKRLCYSVL